MFQPIYLRLILYCVSDREFGDKSTPPSNPEPLPADTNEEEDNEENGPDEEETSLPAIENIQVNYLTLNSKPKTTIKFLKLFFFVLFVIQCFKLSTVIEKQMMKP